MLLPARATLAAVIVGAVIAAPAADAAVSCDRRAGKTLAANESLRLYSKATRHANRILRVCSYRTGRVALLSMSNSRQPLKNSVYAVNGDYAVAIHYSVPPNDVTNRTPGVSRNASRVWNARTGRFVGDPEMPTGLRFRTPVISKDGKIAVIADPSGWALPDRPFEPSTQRQESVVIVSRAAKPSSPWLPIASGPPGSLRDLTVSGDTLVWQNTNGITWAPFAGPSVTPAMD